MSPLNQRNESIEKSITFLKHKHTLQLHYYYFITPKIVLFQLNQLWPVEHILEIFTGQVVTAEMTIQ